MMVDHWKTCDKPHNKLILSKIKILPHSQHSCKKDVLESCNIFHQDFSLSLKNAHRVNHLNFMVWILWSGWLQEGSKD